MKKFFRSVTYAATGIKDALRKRGNILIHLFIAIITIFLGLLLGLKSIEWSIITICIGIVISAEIKNTAIENMVDMISLEKREQSRKIKDMAAGSVLVNAIASAIVGLIIFIPKIIHFLAP